MVILLMLFHNMKIAVLNECFFTDQHFAQLKQIGDVTSYKDTDSLEKAKKRLSGVEVAIVDSFFTPCTEELFQSLPQLKLLAINSTGYDTVDIHSAKKHNITVTNAPGFATESVAELAIGLIFAVIKKIPQSDLEMRKKPFEVDPFNTKDNQYLGFNLKDKTLGILGLGRIGTRTAELAQELGMKVIAWNRSVKKVPGVEMKKTKEEVLAESDVVSLHLALAPELVQVIGKKEFEKMKSHAIFINTARGKLVDENALYDVLMNRKLYGAGLEVLADLSSQNPLLQLPNIVFTPHSGFYNKESLENLADILIETVKSFIEGQPMNVIS